jgi:hypothetical protein
MQLVGESLTIDRTGAATAKVSFFVSKDEKDIMANLPGSYRTLFLTHSEAVQQEDGNYIATGTYQGQDSNVQEKVSAARGGGAPSGGGGATYGLRERATYEWSPTFEQTDIAKHPNIEGLMNKYQGEQDASGSIIFPRELSSSSGQSGLSGGQSGPATVNPMYGVTEFLSLGGVWSETALELNIPNDLFDSIGQVATGVPGSLQTPADRFWLTLPPMISQHGDRWKVVRRWMLSGVSSTRDVEAAQDIYLPSGGGGQGLFPDSIRD